MKKELYLTVLAIFVVLVMSNQIESAYKGNTVAVTEVFEKNVIQVISQDYISKNIGFRFEEINNTHWNVTYKVDEEFLNKIEEYKQMTPPERAVVIEELCNTYGSDKYDCSKTQGRNNFINDILNVEVFPTVSLSEIILDVSEIDLTSQYGSFYMIFPDGFKVDLQARFGFGSTIVNTTTATYSMTLGSDRKTFYAEGQYWIFFVNESDGIAYVTSTDGTSWSAQKHVLDDSEINQNEGFGVWHDGTTAWISASSSTNAYVAFRNLTLSTETLSETKSINVGNGFELYSQIIKTPDGNLWLKTESTYPRFYITKSSNPNSDSSWGSTTLVGTDTSKYGHAIIVPLNATSIMFIHQLGVTINYYPITDPSSLPSAGEIYRCYGSQDWYTIENAENEYLHTMTAVNNGTNSVVWIGANDTQNIRGKWWDGIDWLPNSSGGTAECLNITSETAQYPTMTLDDNTGNLHLLFFDGTSKIKNMTWTSSTGWSATSDDFATAQDSVKYVSSFHNESTNIAITWQNGSSTYQIMFGSISLTAAAAADNTNPTITLNSPDDDSYNTSKWTQFNCTAYDNINLTNVTLWTNETSWSANETNTSGLNNSDYLFNITLPLGHYVWNCRGFDNSSNSAYATANFTLIVNDTVDVDTTKPQITILQPWNTTYDNNTINFNITGNEILSWVVVEISGYNHTLTNQSGEWNYLNDTLANGTYNVMFSFNDTSGNMNHTNITFTIDTTVNVWRLKFIERDTRSGSGTYNASINVYCDTTKEATYEISNTDYGHEDLTLTGCSDGSQITFNFISESGDCRLGIHIYNIEITKDNEYVNFTPWTITKTVSCLRAENHTNQRFTVAFPLGQGCSYSAGDEINLTTSPLVVSSELQINQSDLDFNKTIWNINQGDNIQINATIRNIGSLDENNATIKLYIDDVLNQTLTDIAVTKGDYSTVQFNNTINFGTNKYVKVEVQVTPESDDGLKHNNKAVKYIVKSRPYFYFTDITTLESYKQSSVFPYNVWLTNLNSSCADDYQIDYSSSSAVEYVKAQRLVRMAMCYQFSGNESYANKTREGLTYIGDGSWLWANRSLAGNTTDDQDYGWDDVSDPAYGADWAVGYGIAYNWVHEWIKTNHPEDLPEIRNGIANLSADLYLLAKEFHSYDESQTTISMNDADLEQFQYLGILSILAMSILDYDGDYQDLDGSPYEWIEFSRKTIFEESQTGASLPAVDIGMFDDGWFGTAYMHYYETEYSMYLNLYRNFMYTNLTDFNMVNWYGIVVPTTSLPSGASANFVTAWEYSWTFVGELKGLYDKGTWERNLLSWFVDYVIVNNTEGYSSALSGTDLFSVNDSMLLIYNNTEPTTPDNYSIKSPSGTINVLRNGWNKNDTYLFLKTRHDTRVSGGTAGSFDQMTFDIYAKGAYFIMDSGDARWSEIEQKEDTFELGHTTWLVSESGDMKNIGSVGQTQYTPVTNPSYVNYSMLDENMDYLYAFQYATRWNGLQTSATGTFTNPLNVTRIILFPLRDYFIVADSLVSDGNHNISLVIPFGSTEGFQGDAGNSSDNYLLGNLTINNTLTTWWTEYANASNVSTHPSVENITWEIKPELTSGYGSTENVNISIHLNPTTNIIINVTACHYGDSGVNDDYYHPYAEIEQHDSSKIRYLTVFYPKGVNEAEPTFEQLTVNGGSGDDYATKIINGTDTDIVILGDSGDKYNAGYLGTDCSLAFAKNDTTNHGGFENYLCINGDNITIDNIEQFISNESINIFCNRSSIDSNKTCRINRLIGNSDVNITFYLFNSSDATVIMNGVTLNKGYDWDVVGANTLWVKVNFSSETTLVLKEGSVSAVSDTTAPEITFVSPTPSDGATIANNYLTINISSNEAIDTCIIEFQNINYTGTVAGTICTRSIGSLTEGTVYAYRAYVNDSSGNMNMTNLRTVTYLTEGSSTSGSGLSNKYGELTVYPISYLRTLYANMINKENLFLFADENMYNVKLEIVCSDDESCSWVKFVGDNGLRKGYIITDLLKDVNKTIEFEVVFSEYEEKDYQFFIKITHPDGVVNIPYKFDVGKTAEAKDLLSRILGWFTEKTTLPNGYEISNMLLIFIIIMLITFVIIIKRVFVGRR